MFFCFFFFTLRKSCGDAEFFGTYFLFRCCVNLVSYVCYTPFSLPSCTHRARHLGSAFVLSGASEKDEDACQKCRNWNSIGCLKTLNAVHINEFFFKLWDQMLHYKIRCLQRHPCPNAQKALSVTNQLQLE